MANIVDDPKVQALLDKQAKTHEKALAAAIKADATSTKAAYKNAVSAVKTAFADALDQFKGDKEKTAIVKNIQVRAIGAIQDVQAGE